jgi:hypothetical protein
LARAKFIIGCRYNRPAVAGRAHRVDVAVADEDLRRRAAQRRNGLFVCVLDRILDAILNRTVHRSTARPDKHASDQPNEHTHAARRRQQTTKQTNKQTNKQTLAGRPGKG